MSVNDEIKDALALKFAKEESYPQKFNSDLWKGFLFGFNKAEKMIEEMKEALYMQNKVKVYKDRESFIVQFGDNTTVKLDSDEDILYLKK